MRLSVITRTYRRPLLLKRAAASVTSARVDDLEWLIVDDAEEIDAETQAIAADATAQGVQVRLLAGKRGGRTAAANLGLREATGTYFHLHDDDDTVEPGFYRSTLDFLMREPRYRAVRAMCWRVQETLENGTMKTGRRRRVYPERRTVSLFDAAEVFAYPPIGSVFERQLLVEIGGFDETFDVGEDYDLLLRCLQKADMGTIGQCLATVHVRAQSTDSYANSPIERRFAEEDMLFLNAMVRRDLESGRFGLGALLMLGRMSRRRRNLFDLLDTARKRIGL